MQFAVVNDCKLTFDRESSTIGYCCVVYNRERLSNGLIIEYPSVDDILHTVKYGCNTVPTK